MYLTYVGIQNVGPHKEIHVPLKPGTIGILGANGSGKSTFCNSVYAALTNDFSRFNQAKPDCIRASAKTTDKARIFVEGKHNGSSFKLIRDLKPAKVELHIEGRQIVTKEDEVQAILSHDLGIDRDILQRYVMVPQRGMYDFISHTPAQRAAAYQHLCQTQKAEQIHEVLKAALSKHRNAQVQDNRDSLRLEIAEQEAQAAETLRQLEQARKQLLNEKSHNTATHLVQTAEKLEKAHASLSRLKTLEKKHKERLEHLEGKGPAIAKELVRVQKYLKDKEVAHAKAEKALELWEDYIITKNALSSARQKVIFLQDKVENAKAAHAAVVSKLSPDYTVERAAEVIATLAGKLARVVEDFKAAKAVLSCRGDSCCPTCQQVIPEKYMQNFVNIAETLEREKEELDELITKKKAGLNKFKEAEKNLKEAVNSLNNHQEDLLKIETGFEKIKCDGDKDALEKVVTTYIRISGKENKLRVQVSDITKKTAVAAKTQQQLRNKITTRKSFIASHKLDEEKLLKAKTRLAEHTKVANTAAKLEGEYNTLCKQTLRLMAKLNQEEEAAKRRVKKDKLLNRLEKVKDLFHWSELPKTVAQQNLWQMEDDINNFLGWFDDPYTVEAADDLSFMVEQAGVPGKRKAEALSGGQKAVLAITFRTALAKLFTTDVEMLWLDEPTDGLDSQNMAYFGEALQRYGKQAKGNSQLIVVTHAEELTTCFDQLITF